MTHWLITHGVWHHDIHWLGDLAGLLVIAVLVLASAKPDRKLVLRVLLMIAGWSSLHLFLKGLAHDPYIALYHGFFLAIAVICTYRVIRDRRELLMLYTTAWKICRKAWKDGWRGANEERKQRRAKLALLHELLAENAKLEAENEERKRQLLADGMEPRELAQLLKNANREYPRVIGHEEI